MEVVLLSIMTGTPTTEKHGADADVATEQEQMEEEDVVAAEVEVEAMEITEATQQYLKSQLMMPSSY
jgi:hypothetical protein